LKFVTAGVYFIVFVLSISQAVGYIPELPTMLSYVSDSIGSNFLSAMAQLQWIICQFLVPFGALVLAALSFFTKSQKFKLIGNLAWVFFVLPLSWGVALWFYTSMGFSYDITAILLPGPYPVALGYAIILLILATTALTAVDLMMSKRAPAQIEVVEQAPSVTSSGGGNEQLPLIALICGFVFPVAGIIIGHIALGQIKRGQISSQNKGMATAGTALGYAFTVLAIFSFIAMFSWLALLTANSYNY
jgi:hypothetical protein